MPSNRPAPTAQDKKNTRLGCGIIVAALILIGGCNALISDEDDSKSSTSSPSSSSASDAKPKTTTVENYVGMELQAAQDAAQAEGITHLESSDYTGQGRAQVWDRNWTVCAQTPAAGSSMSTDDTLTFEAVKESEGETCDDPASIAEEDPVTEEETEDPLEEDTSSSTSGSDAGDSSSDDSGDSSSEGDSGSVYYENCAAARAAGAAPVRQGDPGYSSRLDRDGDGVGCDS